MFGSKKRLVREWGQAVDRAVGEERRRECDRGATREPARRVASRRTDLPRGRR